MKDFVDEGFYIYIFLRWGGFFLSIEVFSLLVFVLIQRSKLVVSESLMFKDRRVHRLG